MWLLATALKNDATPPFENSVSELLMTFAETEIFSF
jgi:hypothetical protein